MEQLWKVYSIFKTWCFLKTGIVSTARAGSGARYIVCHVFGDSRISLDLITQASPGDLFVCRNAGNIVPPHGRDDAICASIEYALAVLPIRDIVVCGHSDCGAMKGLLSR